MPSAVLAMTAASRSSSLRRLRTAWQRHGRDSAQVGDRQAGELGPRYRERPNVAGLVDDDQRPGADLGKQFVQVVLGVGYGLASRHLALSGCVARPMGKLPDVDS